MPFEIVTVPCRTDNYAFLLHDAEHNVTALVDAPESAPIRAALAERGWTLTDILITHHHYDHIDGVEDLRALGNVRVIGASADAHRLPVLDLAVAEGDSFILGQESIQVFDVSGHTIGHIAFYAPTTGAVFTADSLMALGCGRLFEGTADTMWSSMQKLAALPAETIVCSGHEYTTSNAAFAVTVDPDNPDLNARVQDVHNKRAKNIPTVPSTLALELATNPFLRANDPKIKAHLGMPDATDAETFARIRSLKDAF